MGTCGMGCRAIVRTAFRVARSERTGQVATVSRRACGPTSCTRSAQRRAARTTRATRGTRTTTSTALRAILTRARAVLATTCSLDMGTTERRRTQDQGIRRGQKAPQAPTGQTGHQVHNIRRQTPLAEAHQPDGPARGGGRHTMGRRRHLCKEHRQAQRGNVRRSNQSSPGGTRRDNDGPRSTATRAMATHQVAQQETKRHDG